MKRIHLLRSLCIGIFVATLSACDSGGGDSSNNNPPVTPPVSPPVTPPVTPPVVPPEPPVAPPEPPIVTPETATLDIITQGKDGVILADAEIFFDEVKVSASDQNGVAQLSSLPADEKGFWVVKVKKAGYVTQAVKVAVQEKMPPLIVHLMPVAETKYIENIEKAQGISSLIMDAHVILPEAALVYADGTPATGKARVELTPWNIDSDDLKAMPANGRAITADNQEVDLISAGLMAVAFYDEAGHALNLAEGKTATLQMSLPFSNIDGHDLSAGGTIPMWYFNESLGLWEETPDVKGEAIVVTRDGEKMLMVEATVPHFSSWNWDFKYTPAGTTFLQCLDPESKPIACSVTASVVLTGGERLVRGTSIGAEGATVYNMPDLVKEITWEAVGLSGGNNRLMGKVTSPLDTTGTGALIPASISIPLSAPYQFTAQCQLPDLTPIACRAKIEFNGSAEVDEYILPAEGAVIYTQQAPQLISWSALQYETQANGDIWKYTAQDSNVSLSGNKLVMTFAALPEEISQQYVYVRCDPQASNYEEVKKYFAIERCEISVGPQAWLQSFAVQAPVVSVTIPTGVVYPLAVLPEWIVQGYKYFYLGASSSIAPPEGIGEGCYFSEYRTLLSDELFDNSGQIYDLSLEGYCGQIPMR
ncbi:MULTISPECIES: hypothetical protein [unclassified Serratia (in: enterobacteria)]|uniref:hypothetical protein n=1 Tax=unclassified Serratia (in: enterobacteria) TaxID=2647522 RepID=UPI000AEF167D|nr:MULTISPECIES: hypothetical protein [unclassified Serratia (in: enterobacteria)]